MPTLPTILKIPMKFERRMKRIVEKGDIKELYRILYESSLDEGEGPGYMGYLFYVLYFTQLIQAYYKYINKNLSLTSRENLRRSYIGKIHIIRKGYISIFSNYEKKFMKSYNIDSEWIKNKILSRRLDTKIDNYYYSIYFKQVRRFIEKYKYGFNLDYERLYRLYISLVKLGIELFLIYSWTVYLYSHIFHFLRNNEDLENIYKIAEEEGVPRKLFNILVKMAKTYGYDSDWVINTIKYIPLIFSVNSKVEYSSKSDSIKINIEIMGAWMPNILLYTFMSFGVKIKALELRDAQRPMCRICRLFWIGIYSSLYGSEIKVLDHTYKYNKGICRISLEAIKESEAT